MKIRNIAGYSNVITQTAGEGNTTTYHRDLWGKVIRVTDANNVNTFYTYDYAGNITSTTDGNGNTTSYEYNSMNLLCRMTDPMNQEARYFYDLQGRLVKEADRNGQEIAYEYNSDNRLTLKYADESLYNRYLYNPDGTLLAAITPETVDQFSYTPNGNLYQKIHNGELELEYAYNRNGSITSVKPKSRMETRYTYDITGMLKTVHDGQTQIAQYSYNPDSTISQILYNTGANVTYQYDRDKNITGMINRNQQGDIISSYAYTYDNNGNQKSKTENGETTYYTYDSLNRLSSVKYPTAGTESYTYDNAGNRLSKRNYNAAGGVPTANIAVSYTYDSLNRMTESLTDDILMTYKGRTTYEYDSNGSLLSETTTQLDYATGQILTTDPATGLPIQPQVKSYSYNAFKQNISVTNADGSYQQNIYDALGLRISTIENGYRSDYVFDRGSIIAELDGSGTLTSMNIRGYGLLAQKDYKGRLNYYLHNAHGDVTSLIDASGKVLNSYTYDAFGNTMVYAETVANRFKYAGEQLDTITGQYYLRARYYDPTVGRFTQEDTYRGDGLNLYAYVGNNPVRYVDPSGNTTISVGGNANIALIGKLGLSAQIAIDFEGNVGILITPQVGLGSPNASIGLTASITSADTIYDLQGIGFEVGVSVLVVGAEYVLGDGYYGGNLNVGASVAPFEGHADLTYTFLIPLRNDQSEEAKTEALSTFKQIYDNMSYADKKLLSEQYGITEDIFENKKNKCEFGN